MKSIVSIFLILTAALTTAPAVVVNGSFEDLSATYVDSPGADHMNTATADGWYIAFASPDWFWGEGPSNLWHTPFGDHFALGAATGLTGGAYREGVGQVVTGLTAGESYTISFHHANGLYYNPGTALYEGVGVTGGWQVLVDGVSVLLTSSTNDNTVAALDHTSDWQSSEVTFTATDTSADIWFVAWRPGDGSQGAGVTFQFLDGVDVSLVPEPSLPLLGGLGGLLALIHRRKKRVL